MLKILSIINSKPFLWAIIAFIITASFFINAHRSNRFAEYKRQLSGQLTKAESELQSSNYKLGLAESELITQIGLYNKLKEYSDSTDKEFGEFAKKHDLVVSSKDQTIAELSYKLKNGTSGTTVAPINDNPTAQDICDSVDKCVIAYWWEDELGRFKLVDPNIFDKGNEEFAVNQVFRVSGEVWAQKNGFLMVKRLVLHEVYLGKNGKYQDIPGAKAKIIDSKFFYHNEPKSELKESKLKLIVASGFRLMPNFGGTFIGLGLELFDYKQFGINTYTSFDFDSINDSAQNIGIAYRPKNLNAAIGLSVGTPFTKLFDEYIININLIFYLND